MTGRPRLVASDLDGTVVRSDGTVSERTRTAMAAVEASGASFVVAGAAGASMEPPVTGRGGGRGGCAGPDAYRVGSSELK